MTGVLRIRFEGLKMKTEQEFDACRLKMEARAGSRQRRGGMPEKAGKALLRTPADAGDSTALEALKKETDRRSDSL